MSLGEGFPSVLTAAQEGADWAWDSLYREYAGPLLGYLRSRGARDGEDLVGEVFLQLARNLRSFEGDEAHFRSWVFMIAHHRLVDERRRAARRPETPVADHDEATLMPVEDAAGEALRSVGTERVRGLLELLTPDQRDVLLLRVIGGLTLEEVAETVGKRVGAVKALQRRGLDALRARAREGVPL